MIARLAASVIVGSLVVRLRPLGIRSAPPLAQFTAPVRPTAPAAAAAAPPPTGTLGRVLPVALAGRLRVGCVELRLGHEFVDDFRFDDFIVGDMLPGERLVELLDRFVGVVEKRLMPLGRRGGWLAPRRAVVPAATPPIIVATPATTSASPPLAALLAVRRARFGRGPFDTGRTLGTRFRGRLGGHRTFRDRGGAMA